MVCEQKINSIKKLDVHAAATCNAAVRPVTAKRRRRRAHQPRRMAIFVWLLLALLGSATAHESCCAKKARLAKLKFITDENAPPPDVDDDGQPRLIPKPDEVKPAGWDDDDDGPWEPSNVENPAYNWTPPLIPNPDYNPPTFLEELQTEVQKALPWVVLGVFVTALLEALQLPVHLLAGLLRRAGPVGGALLGLATPLCSCGALPVAAGFVSAGVPLRVVVAFLTASQSAGLDSAAITWGLLGPVATLCRLGGAVVLAVAAGLAVGGSTTKAVKASSAPRAADGWLLPLLRRLGSPRTVASSLMKSAIGSASEVFPPVLLGLALSTAAVYWLPTLAQVDPNAYDSVAPSHSSHDGGDAAFGWGRGLAVRAAVLGSSLPLQVCEHSTVTLAAGIQKAGGGPGLAFAFLLAAPAVNLPSLLLLLSASRGPSGPSSSVAAAQWVATRVALALTLTALLLSYAVDFAGFDLLVDKEEAESTSGSSMDLPPLVVQASPWVAAVLAAASSAQVLGKRLGKGEAAPKGDCCDEGHAEVAPCCDAPKAAVKAPPAKVSRARSKSPPTAKARNSPQPKKSPPTVTARKSPSPRRTRMRSAGSVRQRA